ncbi:hypothetical protein [Legionella clemsonensis]|uniref:Chromosome partition protein Smc n=1 Tax=Legionella clemsonensis TaxID=1867846 RepID=A0A222P1V0_9GAMM|nr:hypothetical protein [Legionella clemsonensis]ASQ45791.1 hypothetical protein clem_06180 [Legionella clemsonensis]
MVSSFFDKDVHSSAYTRLLTENEKKMRRERISQAEKALQQFKQEIDERSKKLNQISYFIKAKHKLYDQLVIEFQNSPSSQLAEELATLEQAIKELDTMLEQSHPEQVIARLSSRYEELKAEFEQKKSAT